MTKIDVPTNGSRGPSPESPPSAADYSTAFSPRQLAAGFAIIAALLVLIVRRRKKG